MINMRSKKKKREKRKTRAGAVESRAASSKEILAGVRR